MSTKELSIKELAGPHVAIGGGTGNSGISGGEDYIEGAGAGITGGEDFIEGHRQIDERHYR